MPEFYLEVCRFWTCQKKQSSNFNSRVGEKTTETRGSRSRTAHTRRPKGATKLLILFDKEGRSVWSAP